MRPATLRLLSRLAAGAFLALMVTLAVLARRSGVDAATIQRELLALGCLAAPAFVIAFVAGELLHLPGLLFVAVARVVFGPGIGLALAYGGGVLALTVAFLVARKLLSAARATREPWRPKWGLLRRSFERLEAHPIRSVAFLRLTLWFAPPLTYALATTKLRARDHLIGSALGLVVPVVAVSVLSGLL